MVFLDDDESAVDFIPTLCCLQVLDFVGAGPGIALTKDLVKEHSRRAMEVLSVFDESDARKALSNIIIAIGDF